LENDPLRPSGPSSSSGGPSSSSANASSSSSNAGTQMDTGRGSSGNDEIPTDPVNAELSDVFMNVLQTFNQVCNNFREVGIPPVAIVSSSSGPIEFEIPLFQQTFQQAFTGDMFSPLRMPPMSIPNVRQQNSNMPRRESRERTERTMLEMLMSWASMFPHDH